MANLFKTHFRPTRPCHSFSLNRTAHIRTPRNADRVTTLQHRNRAFATDSLLCENGRAVPSPIKWQHARCREISSVTGACQNFEKMEDDSNQFVVDDVSKIIKDTIDTVISGNAYQQDLVQQWSATVSEQCLGALSKLKKSFKYVVTCSIMQKTGAGLHTASSCYWDSATDGTCTVRWENKTMYCIVSVFGLAIWRFYDINKIFIIQ